MKQKLIYVCQQCGATSVQWKGKCQSCGAWNSYIEEVIVEPSKSKPKSLIAPADNEIVTLDNVNVDELERFPTVDTELNRVLGGGIVPGSVILLGGEPGIGKSTILLQLALQNQNDRILYISGEESLNQIRLRASRLGMINPNCFLTAESGLEHIISAAKKTEPEIIIVDSIQTVSSQMVDAAPGSVSQIRECTSELIRLAKKTNAAIFLIGHITKDGYIAGPKLLEHMVDAVLYFEGDRHYNYRILRTMKNRFGSVAEIGIYEMGDKGLRTIENPSEILLTTRSEALSGVSIAATLEGIRPMLIEVQALVSPSPYSTPQRTTTGFDSKRMSMLLAVLEKRCGLRVNIYDVFLNIAGGLKVEDPAIDLSVITAIASSFNDIPIQLDACFAGEVGLSGEIRPVNQIEKRISEAEKLGFKKFFLSSYNEKSITRKFKGIELDYVDTVSKLLYKIF
ncbi:MAG: DNA repair protein RadA [Bacteroidia bacterium]